MVQATVLGATQGIGSAPRLSPAHGQPVSSPPPQSQLHHVGQATSLPSVACTAHPTLTMYVAHHNAGSPTSAIVVCSSGTLVSLPCAHHEYPDPLLPQEAEAGGEQGSQKNLVDAIGAGGKGGGQ